jgi:hypothetical protein
MEKYMKRNSIIVLVLILLASTAMVAQSTSTPGINVQVVGMTYTPNPNIGEQNGTWTYTLKQLPAEGVPISQAYQLEPITISLVSYTPPFTMLQKFTIKLAPPAGGGQ